MDIFVVLVRFGPKIWTKIKRKLKLHHLCHNGAVVCEDLKTTDTENKRETSFEHHIRYCYVQTFSQLFCSYKSNCIIAEFQLKPLVFTALNERSNVEGILSVHNAHFHQVCVANCVHCRYQDICNL